jgi:hypothetical protein
MPPFKLPPAGELLHGVIPLGYSTSEQEITPETYGEYVRMTGGRRPRWVYFSHEWNALQENPREFPDQLVRQINAWKGVPFIRLMLRTSDDTKLPETTFTLQAIANGHFDADLKRWGHQAALAIRDGIPLICEWGTEANGCTFHWSPKHWRRVHPESTSAEAVRLFVDAYRRIIDVIRSADAACRDIRWVLHFDQFADKRHRVFDDPARYELGGHRIDWYGISIYGPQSLNEGDELGKSFEDRLDCAYRVLADFQRHRPLLLCEYGMPHNLCAPRRGPWLQAAWESLLRNTNPANPRWKNLRGCSWWNQAWQDDTMVDMRMQQADLESQRLYLKFLSDPRVLSVSE